MRRFISVMLVLCLLFASAAGGASYAAGYDGGANASIYNDYAYQYGYDSSEAVFLTVVSSSSVRIEWPDYGGTGQIYVVQVKANDGGFEPEAELGANKTSYLYSGVKPSSLYVFRVMLREKPGGREAPYYNEIIYRPSSSKFAPSNPSFEQLSSGELRISWTYAEGAAYETVVERLREGDKEYSVIYSAPAGVNVFIDTGTEPNTQYRYRIKARYSDAVYSDYAEGRVRSAIETPQIIQYYSVSPAGVRVEWLESADANRYELERKQKGEAYYSTVASTRYDRTYYIDNGIVPGERYCYRVRAISRNGAESAYSEEVEVVALFIDVSQGLTAVAAGDYRVELRWQDLGDKESSYEIWRYDEQFPGWALLETVERNTTFYIDDRVGPGERYTYKVRARSAEYDAASRYSAEAYAETVFIPAPTRLRQTGFNGTSVSLAWKDNSPNESRFIIERRNGHAGQWTQVTSVAADVTEKSGLPAPSSAAWYFRVGAYSADHRSIAYSEPILAENGFETYFRGSSYRDDGYADLSGAGGADGSGGAGAGDGGGADVAGAGLDSHTLRELSGLKIVGVSGGRISGAGEEISRGEFVAMLARALRLDSAPIGSFDDVRQGHPYYKEIMQAANLGFARAASGNMFYPDRIITRGEMAEFVYDSLLAAGTPLPGHGATALRPFPDAAEVPDAILTSVRSVFGEHIMIGIGLQDGVRIVGCEQHSTREQAALVVYRYMQWRNG